MDCDSAAVLWAAGLDSAAIAKVLNLENPDGNITEADIWNRLEIIKASARANEALVAARAFLDRITHRSPEGAPTSSLGPENNA